MMQIDCTVMNTRLIHVREDAIPVHMSAHMRGNSNGRQADGGNGETLRNESVSNKPHNGNAYSNETVDEKEFVAGGYYDNNRVYDPYEQQGLAPRQTQQQKGSKLYRRRQDKLRRKQERQSFNSSLANV